MGFLGRFVMIFEEIENQIFNVDEAFRRVRKCAKVRFSISSQVPSTTQPPFRCGAGIKPETPAR
jgi:hypothetical protein